MELTQADVRVAVKTHGRSLAAISCSRISHAATELSTPPLIAIRALFSLLADIFLLQFFRNPPQAVVVLLQIGLKSVRVISVYNGLRPVSIFVSFLDNNL